MKAIDFKKRLYSVEHLSGFRIPSAAAAICDATGNPPLALEDGVVGGALVALDGAHSRGILEHGDGAQAPCVCVC